MTDDTAVVPSGPPFVTLTRARIIGDGPTSEEFGKIMIPVRSIISINRIGGRDYTKVDQLRPNGLLSWIVRETVEEVESMIDETAGVSDQRGSPTRLSTARLEGLGDTLVEAAEEIDAEMYTTYRNYRNNPLNLDRLIRTLTNNPARRAMSEAGVSDLDRVAGHLGAVADDLARLKNLRGSGGDET